MNVMWKRPCKRRLNPVEWRRGFTLIELMVVVVIIAILMGLVLPAITGVRTRAREAQVTNDISQLEKAITAFKVDFGIEPPSQITLYAGAGAWDVRSKGIIKQIWPRFNFANCGGGSTGTTFAVAGAPTQLNLGSGMSTQINLNGAECLVFFLGGMVDTANGAFVGFAKNDTQPFAPRTGSGGITNRTGPFFEFAGALKVPATASAGDSKWTGRMTDKDNDWLPEYRDTLPQQTMPYVYFSAAGGSYRTAPTTAGMPISMSNPWVNTDNRDAAMSSYTLMNYAYYVSFNKTVSPVMSAPHKPKGYQIISPGSDATYGTGGLFNPDSTSGLSTADRDNITNFHSGRLAN